MQGKSPLCRLKNPTVISIWLLVGFHPATRSVQSTPADNTRKRVWQYIEKEKKEKERKFDFQFENVFLFYKFQSFLISIFFGPSLDNIKQNKPSNLLSLFIFSLQTLVHK